MGNIWSKPVITIQQLLEDFSTSLIPPNGYFNHTNVISNQVFELIRGNRNDVVRCFIGGGSGKNTAVLDCNDDYELIVFLNNQTPNSVGKAVNEIENLLKAAGKYDSIDIVNETTVSFAASGLKFYLSVGINAAEFFQPYRQRQEIYSMMMKLANPCDLGHIFTPSLAEDAVKFVRGQSEFVLSVIRLAKHWSNNLGINDDYIPRRNLLVELVAIQACKNVGTWKADIYLALKKFLEMMKNFDRMSFYFNKYYSDTWLWNETKIPRTNLLEKPLVLHPVNPYENLADIDMNQKKELKDFANLVLMKLERVKKEMDSNKKVKDGEIEFIFQKRIGRDYWTGIGEYSDDSD